MRKSITEWNERLDLGGVERDGCVAFTVSDTLVTAAVGHEFMGQAVLQFVGLAPLGSVEGASKGKVGERLKPKRKPRGAAAFSPGADTSENVRLALGGFRRDVAVGGKPLALQHTRRVATGELFVSISSPPATCSICSPMMRKLDVVLTSSSWKPSWCVLAHGVLRVYNARGEGEARQEIEMEHVLGVGYDGDEDAIIVRVVGDKDHAFRVVGVDTHAAEDIGSDKGFLRRAWLRKLRRAAPKIAMNEFCPEELSHEAFVKQSRISHADAPQTRRRRAGRVLGN